MKKFNIVYIEKIKQLSVFFGTPNRLNLFLKKNHSQPLL